MIFRKVYRNVLAFILIIVCAFTVTSCSKYDTIKRNNYDLNINVSDESIPVVELLHIFSDKINEYIDGKKLVDIEAEFHGYDNIMKQQGLIKFIYFELLSNKGEGGYVSTATVTYDSALYKINTIKTVQCPGKANSHGGPDVNVNDWTISFESVLSEFCKNYHDEIVNTEKPYIEIRTTGDTVDIYLFSEDENAYIIKEEDIEMIR